MIARRLLPLALACLIGLAGGGCGSNASSGTAGTTASSATTAGQGQTASGAAPQLTASEKAVKFAECMRENGVRDFPDPGDKNADSYGVSVTPAVFSKAVDACKALKPPGALSSKYTPKQLSAAVRFAQCVRQHGVKDFPDPVNGQPLINTYKIPSSNKPGGMAILNAAGRACGGILKAAAGGQGGSGG